MGRKVAIQAGSYGQEQEFIPFFLGREGMEQKLIRRCVPLAVSHRKGWGARSQLGTAADSPWPLSSAPGRSKTSTHSSNHGNRTLDCSPFI